MAEIQLKRKVTLKHKSGGESLKQPKPPKSKGWLWLLLAAVVVVAVAFLMKKSSSNSSDARVQPEKTTVEQSVEMSKDVEIVGMGETAAATVEKITTPASETKLEDTLVSESATEPAQSTQPALVSTRLQGTIDEKALKVIRGDLGNGEKRKTKIGKRISNNTTES